MRVYIYLILTNGRQHILVNYFPQDLGINNHRPSVMQSKTRSCIVGKKFLTVFLTKKCFKTVLHAFFGKLYLKWKKSWSKSIKLQLLYGKNKKNAKIIKNVYFLLITPHRFSASLQYKLFIYHITHIKIK